MITLSSDTADAKLLNEQSSNIPGAGQGNNSTNPFADPATQSLSQSEITNINNANKGAAAGGTDQDTSNNSNKSESGSDQIAGPDAKIGVGTDNNAAAAQDGASVPASLYYNRLHNFTGYTYKITLWLLTTEDYQKITADPDKFTPTHCLISSSGGTPQSISTDQSSRHPDFLEDFYFDNLSMTTLIGLNSKSKASNAIDLKFTIIEPYGMTLLDRLLSACQTTASCNNYVDQPYLLQIDFLANPMEADQFGAKGHVIDSKRIPIKFTEFKIKPGAGGTNYFVKAMPYNHLGFVQSVAAVPTTLSVTAKTVGEYFDSTVKDLALLFRDAAAVVQQQRIETEINKLDIGSISEEELLSLKERLKAELSNVNSFPNGYNTWYRNAANQAKRSDVPLNLILFAIDPDIAKSLIVDVEKSESKRGVFASPIYSALAGTATGGAGPDFKNKSVFSVLAGTSVIEVINRIVSASEYIKGQIKNAQTEAEKTSGSDITTSDADARTVSAAGYNKLSTPNQTKKIEYKPTDWFKIIPTIYLGKFDLRTNSYSKAILYTILKYNAANAYHPDMALTKIPPAQVVRTYNYYYTGLNQDIINLDIDFDATFVTGIATFTKQIESSTTVAGADKPKEKAPPEPASQPFASTPYAKSVLTPLNSQANPQNQTAEDYSVSSVSRSLYSAYPRGDMLNIRMKIVGDPAFIKQDDIYHNPVQDGYGAVINKVKAPGAPPINEQGQIIFDHEEVYVQILVKSAVDIDDATGITNKTVKLSNGQVANGTFSGLYKIMTVESEFKQGKFEQTLSLIRMPDSMLDNATGTTNNNGGAVVSTATSTAQSDAVPGVKPAATVTTSPVARDATLTGIANGSATSPVPAVAGAGTTAAPNQPSTAAAANVNATQVNIQQQPTPNSTNGIQDFAAIEQEVKILDAQTEAANAQFRAELKKIENNDELTQVEKNKQERALLDERGDALFRAQLGYSRLNTKLGKIIAKMAKVNTFGPEASLERGLQDRVDNVKNDITNNYYAIDRNRRR